MKLLLDTHVLLWWLEDPLLLSSAARQAIKNGKNAVYVSAAVIWELVIKQALGKLSMPDDLASALSMNQFTTLPITAQHALALKALPDHHADPFDRMLIAQSICEGLTIVTRDSIILKYPMLRLIA